MWLYQSEQSWVNFPGVAHTTQMCGIDTVCLLLCIAGLWKRKKPNQTTYMCATLNTKRPTMPILAGKERLRRKELKAQQELRLFKVGLWFPETIFVCLFCLNNLRNYFFQTFFTRGHKRKVKKKSKHVVLSVYLLYRQKNLSTHFVLQNC